MSEMRISDETRDATGAWWLLVALGSLCAVAGIIVLARPSDSITTLAVVVGIFMFLDGLLELAVAIFGRTGSRGLVALMGVLNAVIGIALVRHPLSGVTAVALLIGIWLVAIGLVRTVAAFEDAEHRVLHLLVAAVEVVAGIVVLAQPHIGYTALAIIVGLMLIMRGAGIVALGWAMHVVHHDAAAPGGRRPATA
jgi:uncharacterized membrane protein HdeD (DUF308 family)